MDLHPDLRLLLRAADTSKTTVIIGTCKSGKSRLAAAIAAMNGQATYDGEMHPDRFRWMMSDARMVLPAELTTERKPDDLLVYDTPDACRKFRETGPTDARLIVCLQARCIDENTPPSLLDTTQEPPPVFGASLVLGLYVNGDKRHIIKVYSTKLPMLEGKEIDFTDFLQVMNDWRKAASEGADGDRASG